MVYNRECTVVASRSDFRIASIESLGDATQDPAPDVQGFRQAIDWLLDFHAAEIPAPSSIAAMFWNGQEQMTNRFWNSELATAFQSILAFPIWMFHANNFGNVELSAHEIVANLPQEFYTTAAISTPLTRIIIDRAVFAVFIVFESLVILFALLILAWILMQERKTHVEISSYPLIDFCLKTNFKDVYNEADRREHQIENVLEADDQSILKKYSITIHERRVEHARITA